MPNLKEFSSPTTPRPPSPPAPATITAPAATTAPAAGDNNNSNTNNKQTGPSNVAGCQNPSMPNHTASTDLPPTYIRFTSNDGASYEWYTHEATTWDLPGGRITIGGAEPSQSSAGHSPSRQG